MEVAQCPRDYVSEVLLLEDLRQIIVTSWDGLLTVYDYEVEHRTVSLNSQLRHECALLACCYVDTFHGRQIYVSSVQGEVLQVDLESEGFIPVKNNYATLGIPCISDFQGQLICGSWDGTLQVVDCETNCVVLQERLSDGLKVISMDVDNERMVIATSRNKVRLFELPLRPKDKGTEVESGLKYQARKVKLTPQGDGYVCSSLDGRVAVEYLEDESRKFAFRCHRLNLVDTSMVFPVNALSFRPNSNVLYTGGSDGSVSCWNLTSRKKVEQLPKFNENSVVQLACNEQVLCVATSDDSFKTNATKDETFELQPSRLYIVFF